LENTHVSDHLKDQSFIGNFCKALAKLPIKFMQKLLPTKVMPSDSHLGITRINENTNYANASCWVMPLEYGVLERSTP
jgi:hypothetical protein